jgi:hypothetical protein
MTAVEEAAVQQALNRGALMYAYDQAAWHGTDDFRSKAGQVMSLSGGWIVDGPAETPELVFVDKDEADPHALYIADFRDGRLVSGHVLGAGDDNHLSPMRKRMVAALRTARKALAAAEVAMCVDKPFNTIVLPPTFPQAPILVYFLTPQTETNTFPLGGHYLVTVMPDGSVASIRPFTKSCAPMAIDGKGKPPAALVITHLLDPTPTEIHVFSSLDMHLPLYVVTTQNEKIWAVEGSRIRLVDQSKK